MAYLFNPFYVSVAGSGLPNAGALWYFYQTGTTTPLNTYSDVSLNVSFLNPNPVVADSNGLFGPIYIPNGTDAKAILKTSAGVTIATFDPVLVEHIVSITAPGWMNTLPNTGGLTYFNDVGGWGSPAATMTPTRQVFTASGAGTYTTPSNPAPRQLVIRMIGAGGGGGGTGGTTGPTGATGGSSIFNAITAVGGSGGVGNTGSGVVAGGAGGTGGIGTATVRISGNAGGAPLMVPGGTAVCGGPGGNGPFGGGAAIVAATTSGANAGAAAVANTGGGGGGAGSPGTTQPGGGGGSGEYAELTIDTPTASYAYTVGAKGAGGIGTGTAAATGGAGGDGIIIVQEIY